MTRSWCGRNMSGCNVVDHTVSCGIQTRQTVTESLDMGSMIWVGRCLGRTCCLTLATRSAVAPETAVPVLIG
jgi:hypothetical protein